MRYNAIYSFDALSFHGSRWQFINSSFTPCCDHLRTFKLYKNQITSYVSKVVEIFSFRNFFRQVSPKRINLLTLFFLILHYSDLLLTFCTTSSAKLACRFAVQFVVYSLLCSMLYKN